MFDRDTPSCGTCREWDAKLQRKMAQHGFAACNFDRPQDGRTRSMHHACDRHNPAAAADLDARAAFFATRPHITSGAATPNPHADSPPPVRPAPLDQPAAADPRPAARRKPATRKVPKPEGDG